MKIAYILNCTSPTNGATKAFMNMLDNLTPYGIQPFVVVPDRAGIYQELCKRKIPTLAITYRPSVYPYHNTLKQDILFFPKLAARNLANWKATKILTTWIKQNKIDLVPLKHQRHSHRLQRRAESGDTAHLSYPGIC